jgi:quinoprotein glucose dehydrogenase
MQTETFTPLAIGKDTLVSPGWNGGVEWGGLAFDQDSQLLFVNGSNMPEYTSLAENDRGPATTGRELFRTQCASCHKEDLTGTPPTVPSLVGVGSRRNMEELSAVIENGSAQMPGFAALGPQARNALLQYILSGEDTEAGATVPLDRYRFTGYNRFVDPDGYPAVAFPWGTLNAIDMRTGAYKWTVPFGQYPELVEQGLTDTGSESYGGPIVTAGGVVFIGATLHDKKFRAYDKLTGELLWETTLPFPGTATPITYEVDGRQFVVIAAGGRRVRPSGGVYVAFALPRGD